MTLTTEAFEVMVEEWGQTVTRRPLSGPEETGITVLFKEDRVERGHDQDGEEVKRQANLTVLSTVTYSDGESWVVNGEVWQVSRTPNNGAGVRIIPLQRVDKVATAKTRGHVL